MTTAFVLLATRSSDFDNLRPEIKIQTEDHTLDPTSSQNGLEDPEAFGSVPPCLPSQFLESKPTPGQPEIWYCLEIQVISTEDEKVIPPPPHTWQAPIVEDMVWKGKAGLTEPS